MGWTFYKHVISQYIPSELQAYPLHKGTVGGARCITSRVTLTNVSTDTNVPGSAHFQSRISTPRSGLLDTHITLHAWTLEVSYETRGHQE